MVCGRCSPDSNFGFSQSSTAGVCGMCGTLVSHTTRQRKGKEGKKIVCEELLYRRKRCAKGESGTKEKNLQFLAADARAINRSPCKIRENVEGEENTTIGLGDENHACVSLVRLSNRRVF